MIKLIPEITRNNLFKYKNSERSPQKPLRISCQSVSIPRKITGNFSEKSRVKYMEFEENNEEFEGKITRTLKEKNTGNLLLRHSKNKLTKFSTSFKISIEIHHHNRD